MVAKTNPMSAGSSILVAAGALALGLSAVVSSASTVTIYNTGTDSSGTVLNNGSAVSYYALVLAPSNQGTTLAVYNSSGSYPGNVWAAPNDTSAWIAPASGGAYTNSPATYGLPGNYDFQTTFTSATAGLITISGQWATDNTGSGISIDGVAAAMTSSELPGATGYNSFTSFNITGNVVAGNNTLDFLLANGTTSKNTDGANPVGLRVQIGTAYVVAALPMPGTGPLAALGGLAITGALVLRRRVGLQSI